MSNGSSFLWRSVISFNFKGSGKAPVLRESFIHLHSTCGNILFPFKILKGMSPPDDFVSSNLEITSRTSLAVTGWKEKGLTVMYLLLIFSMLGRFLYLLTILLIGSGSFNVSDVSGHLNNPKDDVID